MSKTMSGTKRRAITCAPIPIEDVERTREIPAETDGTKVTTNQAPVAAPAEVVASEDTVPVQSCIERSLLHEILRRESAEKDK